MFQSPAGHWVGNERFIYDLFDYPEMVEAALEPRRERNSEAVAVSARSEEYGNFLSFKYSSTQIYLPDMYEKRIALEKTERCRILEAGGKSYVPHACGHLWDILPDMTRRGM